jgi:hypothetical protein
LGKKSRKNKRINHQSREREKAIRNNQKLRIKGINARKEFQIILPVLR